MDYSRMNKHKLIEHIDELNKQIKQNEKIKDIDNILEKHKTTIRELTAENNRLREKIKLYDEQGMKRGRPFQITDETRLEIQTMRKTGMTIREIADLKGISIGSVHNILNNRTVSKKSQNKKAKKLYFLTKIDLNKILQYYGGYRKYQINEKIGYDYNRISFQQKEDILKWLTIENDTANNNIIVRMTDNTGRIVKTDKWYIDKGKEPIMK